MFVEDLSLNHDEVFVEDLSLNHDEVFDEDLSLNHDEVFVEVCNEDVMKYSLKYAMKM